MRATERVSIEAGPSGFSQNPVAPGGRYATVSSRWAQSSRSERAFLICGAIIITVFVAAAIAPQLFTRQNPDRLYAGPPLVGPSTSYWFGTDELGRDLYDVWSTRPELR